MPTFAEPRKIADPALNPGDEPYFAAAARGALALKTCKACGRAHHYPRALCPFCWSSDTVWREASGRGEVYSFTVMRRVKVPYALAYVKLDEGPVMLTNLVAPDLDRLAIGQRVRVVYGDAADGAKVPVFTPAEETP